MRKQADDFLPSLDIAQVLRGDSLLAAAPGLRIALCLTWCLESTRRKRRTPWFAEVAARRAEGTINLGCPQAHWLRGGRCDGGLLLDGASSCCMMQCCRVMHPISPQNWTTLRGPCSALPSPNLRRKVSFRQSVNSSTKYGVIEQSDKWLVGRGFS